MMKTKLLRKVRKLYYVSYNEISNHYTLHFSKTGVSVRYYHKEDVISDCRRKRIAYAWDFMIRKGRRKNPELRIY